MMRVHFISRICIKFLEVLLIFDYDFLSSSFFVLLQETNMPFPIAKHPANMLHINYNIYLYTFTHIWMRVIHATTSPTAGVCSCIWFRSTIRASTQYQTSSREPHVRLELINKLVRDVYSRQDMSVSCWVGSLITSRIQTAEIFPIFHCNCNIVAKFLLNISKYFNATLKYQLSEIFL